MFPQKRPLALTALKGALFLSLGIYFMSQAEQLTDSLIALLGLFLLAHSLTSIWSAWPNRSLPQGKRLLYRSGADAVIGLCILLFPSLLHSFVSGLIGLWLLLQSLSFVWTSLRSTNLRRPIFLWIFWIGLGLGGIWMMMNPSAFLSGITSLIGFLLCIAGLFFLGMAWNMHRMTGN